MPLWAETNCGNTGVNIHQLFGLQHCSGKLRLATSPDYRSNSICISASMLRSLGLLLPRSAHLDRFQLLRNTAILPPRDDLQLQAQSGLDTARQHIFQKIKKFPWTTLALHQHQGKHPQIILTMFYAKVACCNMID
ncbi:hypothetical protein UPYG_G00033870 [Umbra pygmaea]|uniref:Uncharacterized protein n=1 Tax=Umbra pygmaea TaxID=75934 RepID=A0ABD0Y1Z5_UMBPY